MSKTYGLNEAFNELDLLWTESKVEKTSKLNEGLRAKLQERKALKEAAEDEVIEDEVTEEEVVENEVAEFDVEAFKAQVEALLQVDEDGNIIESEFNDAINAVLGLFDVAEAAEEAAEEEIEEVAEEEVEECLKEDIEENDISEDEYEANANEFIASIANMSVDEAKNYYYNDYKFDKATPEDAVEQRVADALLAKINSVEECLKEEAEVCTACGKNPCECK